MTMTMARLQDAVRPPTERDRVRLLLATPDGIAHRRFDGLPGELRAGDLLVVNDSATLPAAVPARDPAGVELRLHLSTLQPGGLWAAEIRQPDGPGSRRITGRSWAGTELSLPDGGTARVLAPHPADRPDARLQHVHLVLPAPLLTYLAAHGQPIRYAHTAGEWPLDAYQTVFATRPGSAEMPSAARPFTPRVLGELRRRGVELATITLHTGVSSMEDHEPPYAERYHVPEATADAIGRAARTIAVGTTVVRALETTTDSRGLVHPGGGWTDLVIVPDRPVRSVDGLITGWHDPEASHLDLLRAVAGRELVDAAYAAAAAEGYRAHEFGDSALLLTPTRYSV